MRLLILNGPNLARLGKREPEVYGSTTYDELASICVAEASHHGFDAEVRQTDDEATIIGWLHEAADSRTPVIINPAAFKFDPLKDLAPVSQMTLGCYLLIVPNSSPASNVRELVALAKSKPGKLNYSTGGSGTTSHFGMELFKSVTATDIAHIPFKGGSEPIIEVMAGRIDVVFETLTGGYTYIQGGKVRARQLNTPKLEGVLPNPGYAG